MLRSSIAYGTFFLDRQPFLRSYPGVDAVVGADVAQEPPGRHRGLADAAHYQRHRLQVVGEDPAQQVRLRQGRRLGQQRR